MRWRPVRVTSEQYRRILIACLATLLISAGALVLFAASRWRTEHALHGDTEVVLTQATQQLRRAFQSRRGTLTLLRDTLDRAPNLSASEQQALARSAVAHTRNLLATGSSASGSPITWWVMPSTRTPRERTLLEGAIRQQMSLTRAWKVPHAFTVSAEQQGQRPLLVMTEPRRPQAPPAAIVIGVFDLTPLLTDFFELTLQQPYPVQVRDGERILYQSTRWTTPSSGTSPTSVQRPLRMGDVNWSLHMQPGRTQMAKTASTLQKWLLVIGWLAAVSLIGIIWLLSMRTRILQRAVGRRTAALRRALGRVRQLAITDELTGLYNRRYFMDRWTWECQRAKRYQRPLACVMIDVNGFKRINDTLGHAVGDAVLAYAATDLKRQLRESDLLARVGGDEFVIALPETDVAQAEAVVEKLRQLQIQGTWPTPPGPIRLSVGLAHLGSNDQPDHVLQRADQDLYASRRAAQSPADRRGAPLNVAAG